MKQFLASTLAIALAATGLVGSGMVASGAVIAEAQAQSRDQESARAEMQAGRGMRISEIERRIIPQMGDAKYLGFEYENGVYRLKFMRGTRVIWVDVDAQTARVIRVQR